MLSESDRQQVFAELCAGAWSFHGWDPTIYHNHRLGTDVLQLIVERVRSTMSTVETGCGYSTVAFALCGSTHTVVSPSPWEHDRVRSWSESRGVSTESVRFIVGKSEEVLPDLDAGPFDFALIDGDHAFPIPFLDFFYVARHMQLGSVLVVDDTQIVTGRILQDFLASERDRWRQVVKFETAVAFERLGGDLIDGAGWLSQPFCAERLSEQSRWRSRFGAVVERLRTQRPE